MIKEKIHICEVGPRDGLQMAAAIMPTQVKLDWIGQLLAAGLPEVEAGSFVPAKLVPQMADTPQIITSLTQVYSSGISALAPNLKGAQLAYAAGARAVIVPVSVSDGHSLANTRKSTVDQISEVAKIAAWIREQDRPMRLDVGCATALGCSIEGVIPERRVIEVAVALAQAGADVIVLSDTVGYGHPAQVRALIRAVRREVGNKLQKLHLHDTMGLGLANALAGLEEGIRGFDASLAGLGGGLLAGRPFPAAGLPVIAAGGISSIDDLLAVRDLGCEAAVAGSALPHVRAAPGAFRPRPAPRRARPAGAPHLQSWPGGEEEERRKR
jgi:hydroxymethylglutaryl-CoA lyase